jgi:hypothetical protein
MSLKAKQVDAMWHKLGFTILRGRKDIVATLTLDGRLAVHTKRSHGTKTLDGQIPDLIKRQMYLSRRQFDDAIECPLTREAYEAIVRERNEQIRTASNRPASPGRSPQDS